MKKEQFS